MVGRGTQVQQRQPVASCALHGMGWVSGLTRLQPCRAISGQLAGGVYRRQCRGSRDCSPISGWWLHNDLLGLLHFPLVCYKHIYTTRVTDKFPL